LLEERIRRHGPKHAVVGAALCELGRVHLHFCEFKQAEKCFARAAAIQNRSKKAHPLDVVVRPLTRNVLSLLLVVLTFLIASQASLVNLGKARLGLGKSHAARTVFRDAVRIIRTKLGYDHIRVAETQGQIGYLLFEAGDLPCALNAFADALAVYRSLLVHDEMNTLFRVGVSEMLCNIGSIHLEERNFDPAVECFLEALQVSCFVSASSHSIVALSSYAF
jgi:tetratricopeptide (TPR) repeat protein